jgi:hypothetical protein
MNRTQTNFGLDASILILFLALLLTGLLMSFAIPHGIGRDAQLWSLTRDDWSEVHFWIAMTFLAAIAAHFVLHWTWIKATAMGKLVNKPLLMTLLLTIALMIGVFFAALASAPSGDLLAEGEHRHERRGGGMGYRP